MRKLELKHLAPYLPYGLKLKVNGNEKDIFKLYRLELGLKNAGNCFAPIDDGVKCVEMNTVSRTVWEFYLSEFKPILRPLSDLTKEELEEFYDLNKVEKGTLEILHTSSANWYETIWDIRFKHIDGIGIEKDGLFYTSFGIRTDARYTEEQFNWFYSKHIDTKGLIEKGLAIDINTLK